MRHALSFDIEDWFHIAGIPHLERRGNWHEFSSIVEEKTRLILEILDEYDVKATFFVLGWIAEEYPELLKKMAANGHEIGTHGYWHYRVNTISRTMFRVYLERSISVLEDISGVEVKGYRAPSFSITPGTEWAFDIMEDAGLEYDASLFPAERGHGGYNIAPGPQRLDATISKTNILVLPMSMIELGITNIPFSGGGYMRFWPKPILKYGFNRLEKKGIPAVVYLHPRDFAPNSPRVKMPLHRKFKSYYGLSSTKGKLKMLLENYQFDTCEAVLKDWFNVDDLSEVRKKSNKKETVAQ